MVDRAGARLRAVQVAAAAAIAAANAGVGDEVAGLIRTHNPNGFTFLGVARVVAALPGIVDRAFAATAGAVSRATEDAETAADGD